MGNESDENPQVRGAARGSVVHVATAYPGYLMHREKTYEIEIEIDAGTTREEVYSRLANNVMRRSGVDIGLWVQSELAHDPRMPFDASVDHGVCAQFEVRTFGG